MRYITERPWGYYRVLYQGENILIRTLTIYRTEETDLHRHNHRAETFSLISGSGSVFVAGTEYDLSGVVHVPVYSFHKIKNTGSTQLVVYEVQAGDISEDDLIEIEGKT